MRIRFWGPKLVVAIGVCDTAAIAGRALFLFSHVSHAHSRAVHKVGRYPRHTECKIPKSQSHVAPPWWRMQGEI